MKRLLLMVFLAGMSSCGNREGKKNILPMIDRKEITIEDRLMTPEVLWHFGRVGNVKVSPGGKTVAYTVTWYDIDRNASNTEIYVADTDGNSKRRLTHTPERETALQWHPDGEYLGFVRNGAIFEIHPDGTGERKIAIAGDMPVNEFVWSPDGSKLLFSADTRVTATLGRDVHPDLPKAEAYIADDLMYRHWDTWSDGTFSHLYIADYSGGTTGTPLDIMNDEPWDAPMKPFDDISEVSWSPDGRRVAYSCKKLTGKDYAESTDSDIYLYTLETRETVNLTEGMNGYDKQPSFSPDGQRLLWLSMERAGYEADKQRIFICDLASGTKTDCSKDFDSSPSSTVWAKDGKSLYLTACFDETFRIFQMTFTADGGKYRQISRDGYFDYQHVAEAGEALIATRSQIIRPPEIFRIDLRTGEGTELSFVNRELLAQLDLPEMEQHYISTSDGKKMPAWVILPPKIDRTKPYPCIMMCTGGPQGEVSQSYSYRWNYALMASRGYAVVYPARRGVSGYGQEWADAVSKDHGGQPERDLLSAADYMASQPWIDANRMGAVGASYGGFSVFWLAGNHQKRFKMFIAHCGIFSMEGMALTTEELFFENWETGGPFWEARNRKAYSQSPVNFIGKWDTPILVMHGEHDYRVPYTQGLAAFNAARITGIPARLVVFPGETHWVLRPQNAILWQREFFAWADRYLK
jgi:dipeptidyl aminopeptidase/acylaminoacyl peptidase